MPMVPTTCLVTRLCLHSLDGLAVSRLMAGTILISSATSATSSPDTNRLPRLITNEATEPLSGGYVEVAWRTEGRADWGSAAS
jgi:hypothetical protein